ncbi:hypothetical protein PHLCEN_2v2042, partial [Hermanssonia centrifuga]
LTPNIKGAYFKKNWDTVLQREAESLIEKVFRERYTKLYSESVPPEPTHRQPIRSKRSLRALSDDESDTAAPAPTPFHSITKPWMSEFQRYLGTTEEIQQGTSTIQWWGANAYWYPVWASLARDYLSIMATSVSSERAFSQGGITLSKRRSCLKGDVVEALQCLKCMIRRDLLFKEAAPSSATEEMLDDDLVEGLWTDSEPVLVDTSINEANTQVDLEDESQGAWDLILVEEDEDY